jgi:hypothetical protein
VENSGGTVQFYPPTQKTAGGLLRRSNPPVLRSLSANSEGKGGRISPKFHRKNLTTLHSFQRGDAGSPRRSPLEPGRTLPSVRRALILGRL